MKPLDFRELAEVVNLTRTTEIRKTPLRRKEGGYSLYEGEYKVHTHKKGFQLLYLHSSATKQSLEEVLREPALLNQDVHVVYPPSLGLSPDYRASLAARAVAVWTTKEFVSSFLRDELAAYAQRLGAQKPQYYVDPQIETPSSVPRKIPNPLLSFLAERDFGCGDREGALAVVLAEAGQGKTYMCEYLVSQIPSRSDRVPIYVDSKQWSNIPKEDLSSLWKTITHSFRFFGAPIPWIDGQEDTFIRATLRVQLFVIVFDGFDEYILRNSGLVDPLEVLEQLAELAAESGTRIVITSRSSFWESNLPAEERSALVQRCAISVYKILPFEQQQARNYFTQRLQSTEKIERAAQLYGTLRNQNPELIGRGFVLSLIADLVERLEEPVDAGPNALSSLLEALCARESHRQQLPLDASEQLTAFRTLAAEIAAGQQATTDLVRLALQDARPELSQVDTDTTVEKLRSHPLIGAEGDIWSFREQQVNVLLFAQELARSSDDWRRKIAAKLRLDSSQGHDVASMLVDVIRGDQREVAGALRSIIRAFAESAHPDRAPDTAALATRIALVAVDRLIQQGSTHAERSAFLAELCGGAASTFSGLLFRGTLKGLAFSDARFVGCKFDRVVWADCEFGKGATFEKCEFLGGTAIRTETLGLARFSDDCRFDAEAFVWVRNAQVSAGRRQYSLQDLERDFSCVLARFVRPGAFTLHRVQERHLKRGAISASRHRDDIIEALMSSVLETHEISGTTDKGVNVRPRAEDAVKFFAANNVRQGAVAEAFDRLARRLGLR